jgi:hypothetical protein
MIWLPPCDWPFLAGAALAAPTAVVERSTTTAATTLAVCRERLEVPNKVAALRDC